MKVFRDRELFGILTKKGTFTVLEKRDMADFPICRTSRKVKQETIEAEIGNAEIELSF